MKKIILDFINGDQQILKVPTLTNKELIKKSVLSKIDKELPTYNVVKISLISSSIAASFLILISLSFLLTNYSEWNIQTKKSGLANFYLPDQSEVFLNYESSLIFNPFVWPNNRKLKCSGELYFDVKPGNVFTVQTQNGSVEVLGTKFNVFSRNKDFHTDCYSGKVKIYNDQNETIIEANEQAILIENKTFIKQELNKHLINHNWRNGEFYYHNTSLNLILQELERQFNIDFIVSTNIDRNYTGYFSNKNLNLALKMVFEPLGIKYNISNNKVILE